jgi:APA family basic amino acid/polyamine antiporter
MRAAAIVMPLPRRSDGASLFGKTLETVLAERPCRVIIESSPDGDGTTDGRRRALERDRQPA